MHAALGCCFFGTPPVHRDLHPGNIFVRERVGCRPTYELGDLGESKLVPQHMAARNTTGVGALFYMAPEMKLVHHTH